jgi:hypothetical protein
MTTLLIALVSLVSATEVGDTRKFGLGAEFGNGTYLNLSAKQWTSDTTGIAAHIGTNFFYHEAGARFEKTFLKGEDWVDFAEIPVWWWVGADVGYYNIYGYSGVQVGGSGGVAAAVQLHDSPVEVFSQAGIGVFPLNYCSNLAAYYGTAVSAACMVQGRGTAGVRYYFP